MFSDLLFQGRSRGLVGIWDREKQIGYGGREAYRKVEEVCARIGRSETFHWGVSRAVMALLSEDFNPSWRKRVTERMQPG